MGEYGYEEGGGVQLPHPPEQEISFAPTLVFLVIGIAPLTMMTLFWFRSGTGLNPLLVGFVFTGFASFAMAVNYFLFYRQNKPRSVLVPPNVWKALPVAILLIGMGTFNLLASTKGYGLTLSPGPRIESGQFDNVLYKIVGTAFSQGSITPPKPPPRKKVDLKKNQWMVRGVYMNGALWGALGYAVPFAIMGLLFGLFRKEIVDPRDEHIGSSAPAALVKGAVGMYYGMAIGFAIGATLIFVLRTLFPTLTPYTPSGIMNFVYVLGASNNPNVNFQFAFSAASLLAGAFALFGGKPDLTAVLSDPKAPELTRPLDVRIPDIAEPPQMGFDLGQVRAESQQILQQFQGQIGRMLEGPEWEYERYDLPPVGRHGKKPEAEPTNVVSPHDLAEEDEDAPTAMGSLSNVYVQITAELGKLEVPAVEWLGLTEGAILELPKSADGTIGISINGRPAGRGRPVTLDGRNYKAVKVVGLRAKIEQLTRG